MFSTSPIENNLTKNGIMHSQETWTLQKKETKIRTGQKMVDLKEPDLKNKEEKGLNLEIDLEIGLILGKTRKKKKEQRKEKNRNLFLEIDLGIGLALKADQDQETDQKKEDTEIKAQGTEEM